MNSRGSRPVGWCARRESNPHIFRYWNLNPARLPVPPRARLKKAPPIARMAVRATRRTGVRSFKRENRMQQHPPETPPRTPAQPSQPGQPVEPPPETPPQGPDVDVPTPPSPGTDPSPGPISPVG